MRVHSPAWRPHFDLAAAAQPVANTLHHHWAELCVEDENPPWPPSHLSLIAFLKASCSSVGQGRPSRSRFSLSRRCSTAAACSPPITEMLWCVGREWGQGMPGRVGATLDPAFHISQSENGMQGWADALGCPFPDLLHKLVRCRQLTERWATCRGSLGSRPVRTCRSSPPRSCRP